MKIEFKKSFGKLSTLGNHALLPLIKDNKNKSAFIVVMLFQIKTNRVIN